MESYPPPTVYERKKNTNSGKGEREVQDSEDSLYAGNAEP